MAVAFPAREGLRKVPVQRLLPEVETYPVIADVPGRGQILSRFRRADRFGPELFPDIPGGAHFHHIIADIGKGIAQGHKIALGRKHQHGAQLPLNHQIPAHANAQQRVQPREGVKGLHAHILHEGIAGGGAAFGDGEEVVPVLRKGRGIVGPDGLVALDELLESAGVGFRGTGKTVFCLLRNGCEQIVGKNGDDGQHKGPPEAASGAACRAWRRR